MTNNTFDLYSSGMYRAVEKAGSVAKLAAALGVKRQAAYDWLKRSYAPPRRAIQIEELYGIPRGETMDPKLKTVLSGTANEKARAGEVEYQPRPRPESDANDLV